MTRLISREENMENAFSPLHSALRSYWIYLRKNFSRKRADFSLEKHPTGAHTRMQLLYIASPSIASIIDGIVFLVKNVSSCEQISIFQTEQNKC